MRPPAETLDEVLSRVAQCNLPMMLMKRRRKLQIAQVSQLEQIATIYEQCAVTLRTLIKEARHG